MQATLTRLPALIAFLVTSASLAQAQPASVPTLPDTPQGQHVQAYLEAFNKHDDDHTRRFIAQHFAPAILEKYGVDELLSEFKIDQDEQGLVSLTQVEAQPDGQIEVVVQSDVTGERLQITFGFEDEAPHRIRGLGVSIIE